MNNLRRTLSDYWRDTLLRRVLRNSGYLFSSNTVSAALSFAQGIFAVRLLGIEGFGLVSGTIIVFASNVNRLLSFRMSEVVVKYLGEALGRDQKRRAGAVVKGVALADALTSLVAYAVLLALTPWAARTLGKDAATAPLFAFYGLVLLANMLYETSTGVLQATNHFDRIAVINLIQSIITAGVIFAAYLMHGGMWDVLAAYLMGKTFAGLTITLTAFLALNRRLGRGWWRAPLRLLDDWRAIATFAVSTNLNGTVNLLARDNVPLYLAGLRSQAEVGYFKLALSIINLVKLPIEPFIWPTYAEIAQAIALHRWEATRRLLRRVSTIAAAWTLPAGGGLVLLGWWLIPLVYGAESAPAYPALAILLIGFGFASILHWNRPLLLALGKPAYPLTVAALVG
ncbi:MAG: lipopolysaccharide biosynthesis protein, partial [Anaerolineae bacterium]